MKKLFHVSGIALLAALCLSLGSCKKDEPKNSGGSGSSSIGDTTLPKASFAFLTESESWNDRYISSILFCDKDIRNADKWTESTVYTVYTIDLVTNGPVEVTDIPTGTFTVRNIYANRVPEGSARLYFAINAGYDSEGELQGGMTEGSTITISKNNNSYTFKAEGSAIVYGENQSPSQGVEEPFSFSYTGSVIDATYLEG